MKILWIPHTGWQIPQRAHSFCRELTQKNEVHVTNWVADFQSINDYVSRKFIKNFTYYQYKDETITIHGIPRISPALYSQILRRINSVIFSWYVQRIIAQYKIDTVVSTFVVPPPNAPRLIFDLFDDNVAYWRSYGKAPTYADEIERNEKDYLNKADVVITASSVLIDKAKHLRSQGQIFYIPNGINLELYKNISGISVRKKNGLEGKIIGSIGNHDKYNELEKIITLAEILKKENLKFWIAGRGTGVPTAQRIAKQKGLSNILFTGYVAPNELPNAVARLDVGLCPYAKTPGADASCPMRLLSYSAAGIPVVCTNLEEVKRMGFSNVILVNDNVEALIEGISIALRKEKQVPPQLINYDNKYLVNKLQNILDNL